MKSSFTIIVILSVLFVGQIAATGAAEKMDADIIVEKSRIVIEEMIRSPDNELALDLIKKSAGLAIIPGMLKAGFVLGGSYGKGVILAHRDGRWTGPAFVYIWAGSLGLQIGVQSTDLILVVMGQKAMRSFLKSKFKLGGDVAFAAGPIGARASASTEILLRGGIYSYSRSKGLFAGGSLEGAGMGTDFELNRAYYTTTVNPDKILYEEVVTLPTGKKLIETLSQIQ